MEGDQMNRGIADLTELLKVIALMTQKDHLFFIKRGDHFKPCRNGCARRNHRKIRTVSTACMCAFWDGTRVREAELRQNVGTIIMLDECLLRGHSQTWGCGRGNETIVGPESAGGYPCQEE